MKNFLNWFFAMMFLLLPTFLMADGMGGSGCSLLSSLGMSCTCSSCLTSFFIWFAVAYIALYFVWNMVMVQLCNTLRSMQWWHPAAIFLLGFILCMPCHKKKCGDCGDCASKSGMSKMSCHDEAGSEAAPAAPEASPAPEVAPEVTPEH